MGERDIRAALQRALSEKPNRSIRKMFVDAERSQYEERETRRHRIELDKLGGRFEWIGSVWSNQIMGKSIVISVKEVKQEWQELLSRLASTEEEERTQLISKLAHGLMLSEDQDLEGIRRNIVVGDNQNIFDRKRFTPASRVFLRTVAELSDYSAKQSKSFEGFVNKRVDWSHGLVTLPQTFPVVADWFVQSRNSPQSFKLS